MTRGRRGYPGGILGARLLHGHRQERTEMAENTAMMDGNEAVAHVAYKVNEVIAIYPITPSSPMGEHSRRLERRRARRTSGGVCL